MISGAATWNYIERRLTRTVLTIISNLGAPSAAGSRMRISVTGGTVTVTSGSSGPYQNRLIGKIIEVWGTGGSGTLLDPGDYTFNSLTGAITIQDGTYLILIFS